MMWVFGFNVTVFGVIDCPYFIENDNPRLSYTLIAVIAAEYLMVFIFAFLTMNSDTTDKVIYIEREKRARGEEFPEDDYEFYCDRCDAHVEETSKHCRRCNRCTGEFDHHCVWLNNCIGSSNYHQFLALIMIFTLQLGSQAVI